MDEPTKQGKRSLWLAVAAGVLVLLATAALFWKPVLVAWNVARAESMFRSSYSHGSQVQIQMTNVDWTVEFLGQCGWERIQELKADPAITNEGKEKLDTFTVLIGNGLARAELEELRHQSAWPDSAFWDYVVACNEEAGKD